MSFTAPSEILRKFTEKPLFFYSLIILLGFIPLFYKLGDPVLNMWDESRRAVNAYEMMKGGDLIVTYFNGEPEMWGTKPPLLIWFQALSFRIFGMNEFALRFPVALSGMMLGLLLVWFSGRFFKDHLIGIIASLILFTSSGFISVHGARTGDFDVLLTLFTTWAAISLFLSTRAEESRGRNLHILSFFIAFTLAVLTKGIAAFMLAPGFLIYIIMTRNLLHWLKSRNFWIGLAILAVFVGGYYMLRELKNPGYLQAVMENEMTGRYFGTQEENEAPFIYYLKALYQFQFLNWYYLVPLGILFGYFMRDRRITDLLNFSIIVTVLYLLIISASKTKLEWYDLPLFPFLALMAGLFFHAVIVLIRKSSFIPSPAAKEIMVFCLLLFFFIRPYYQVFKHNSTESAFRQETYQISHFLRDKIDDKTDRTTQYNIVHLGENQHLVFYSYLLEEKGCRVLFIQPDSVREGVPYIVHQPEVLDSIRRHYITDIKEIENGIYSISISGTVPDELPGI